MTRHEKYKENESFIANCTSLLLTHDRSVYKKQNQFNKRLTSKDQNNIIDYISSLRKENKHIRHEAIINPKTLKYEYYTTYINKPSKFNTTA